MAIIKCKMCGGDLDISEGLTVCECEYCGSKQTVPSADNEKKLTLFARANRLRLANEFDKAAGVYESIVADFPEEAEAYWGLVLCRYGIEYVDDPATGRKIPTCHRSSFESVMEDTDFEQACENADGVARRQYRDEAKQIEELRKGIIEVSGKEAPYDIFICYKETDENGDRTLDSVLAQDVYDALTDKGYRVFFSRISLEDKLGTEYEPYIFAALNSAKVMLAFGTDYEYYNAVWVKNEWSRFLKLMASDKSKHLIPCYKGIDAYDMPKEFAKLQAQDMGKVGAMQDLLRGVDKLFPKSAEAKPEQPTQPQVIQQVVQGGGPNVAALLQRGSMALEDEEWGLAKGYFDQVLNMNAKCAEAFLGLAMAEAELNDRNKLAAAFAQGNTELAESKNLARSRQFADETLRAWLEELDAKYAESIERKRKEAEKRAEYLRPIRQRIEPAFRMIAACGYTVGLKSDGTVVATGNNKEGRCDVGKWSDIVAITARWAHTVGLKADGTAIAVGYNGSGACNVGGWKEIVGVAAGRDFTVGLKSDGTVIAVGDSGYGACDIGDWMDIAAIAAGIEYTVGLKANGTVIAAGDNDYGQCVVDSWTDIVAVAAGRSHTVGLKADGTVVATGQNDKGECDVGDWRDVVAIAAGWDHTVGLKADGTVVATGRNNNGMCAVGGWTDIVAVAAGSEYTVALKSDGTIATVGKNNDGQCDVGGWKLFDSVDTIEQERKETVERRHKEEKERAERERREEEEYAERKRQEVERKRREAAERVERERQAAEACQSRIAELESKKAVLQNELANLKGLFSGKQRKEIEAHLAKIDSEMKYCKAKLDVIK